MNRAKPTASELKLVFNSYLNDSSLVICDGLKSYNALSSELGCTIKDVNCETDNFFHLNNANGFHSYIKHQYKLYRGVATKYLNRYNVLLSKMYRAAKSFSDEIYNMLCENNSESYYYSKNTLKSLRLLDI